MTVEKLTPQALQVLALAKKEAQNLKNSSAGTEHLLLGLLDAPSEFIRMMLTKYGVSADLLKTTIYENIGVGTKAPKDFDSIMFTPRVNKIITQASNYAHKTSCEKADVEHLFYSLLAEKNGMAGSIFSNFSIDTHELAKDFKGYISTKTDTPSVTAGTQPAPNVVTHRKKLVSKFLNAFGTDLTQLALESKLEPIIGREQEIEQMEEILCQRTKNNPFLVGSAGCGKTAIVEGLAQRIIEGKTCPLLKNKYIVSLDLAGMLAGTKLRGQFEERVKNIFNEVRHNKNVILFIDEAHQMIGAGSSEGAADLSNIIKPALARGELSCIAASTPIEYKKSIEKDAALERRFQSIFVKPSTIPETVQILNGIKSRYADFHHVEYEPDALNSIAVLTDRYMPQMQLPDKAITILDAAGAIKRIEIERNNSSENKVTVADVRKAISKKTGIPDYKLTDGKSKILELENLLKSEVIGQNHAIEKVCDSLKRAYAELRDNKRPIGSFLFLGQTGMGKTHICKRLAEHLFGSEKSIIQVDMSEYGESHTTSTLIGAPVGYNSAEHGGKLTEAIKHKPFSLVLFDEIEKGHPSVIQLLLQILEEGRLTDRSGSEYSFKNAIIVMTSNLGAKALQSTAGTMGFKQSESIKTDKALEEVKKFFEPEFLNRLDEIVVFNKLTPDDVKQVLTISLRAYERKLMDKNISITIEQPVYDYLLKNSYSDLYGAREVRRVLQKNFETPLANFLLLNSNSGYHNINVSLKDELVTFNAT